MESARFTFLFSILTLSLALLFTSVHADVLNVPDDFETIQAAIDASEDGDTVLVQPGVYVENINFYGDIVVMGNPDDPSEVVIDGNDNGTVVTFVNGENGDAVVTGFTIRNGDAENGGGIYCEDSSPTINFCHVIENDCHNYGAGITCHNSNPTITNCIISHNSSSMYGGGIGCGGSNPIITNCIISENESGTGGAGIACSDSNPIISYCEISSNYSESHSGGIYCHWRSSPAIINCTIVLNLACLSCGGCRSSGESNPLIINSIIWNNEPDQVLLVEHRNYLTSIEIFYSNLQDSINGVADNGNDFNWGEGNIDENPLFADPDNGDYHLTADSPCIDAGDPDSPEDPDGTRADMGAFYFDQLDVPKSKEVIPEDFKLFPAFPNPFNSQVAIRYSLPFPTHISLVVYNPLGQRLRTLFEGYKHPGFHTVNLNADNLPSGLYFIRLETSGQVSSQKVMLVK